MTESQITRSILQHLRKEYPSAVIWKLHEDSVFGVVGVPDIMFAYNSQVWFFEVKTPDGRTSKKQDSVIANLAMNGIHVHVVRNLDTVKRFLDCEL